MYVSRAVKSIREDPVEGESVRLVLETKSDAEPDAVAEAAEDVGGTVERELQFDDLEVSISHEGVDDICEIEGLSAIQTADAIGTHPDEAEEDIDMSERE